MLNDVLLLAPAAGAGIGKKLAEELTNDPEFLSLLVAAAKDGLRATRSFWVGKNGGGHLEVEADFRVRIQALALLLAHMEGEPIKRIIHQHLGGTGPLDPLAALQDSPELREAARKMLEKAEWKTSGRQAHKRPEKIVQAEPADQAPAPGGF